MSDLGFLKKDENDQLSLKHSGNSYYDQIQEQMGVTGIKNCDLWRKKEGNAFPTYKIPQRLCLPCTEEWKAWKRQWRQP